MAHAPNPTGVILRSEIPSLRVSIRILSTSGTIARFPGAIMLILLQWHWMNRARRKLEGSREEKREIFQFTGIAASSEMVSSSGFVMGTCWEPQQGRKRAESYLHGSSETVQSIH